MTRNIFYEGGGGPREVPKNLRSNILLFASDKKLKVDTLHYAKNNILLRNIAKYIINKEFLFIFKLI